MEEIISAKLKEIEEQYHVRVLLAVESGSRAWGFASASSDFDVRFIYIHQPEWYLSIDPQGTGSKRDVIEYPIHNNVDLSGWELTKALRLFRKSNPTILEWLKSDIVYYGNQSFVERLHALETDIFNPIPAAHHYFNLARGNFNKYFQGKDSKIKVCLYIVKSLLSCLWIEKNHSFPPVRIQELLTASTDEKLKQEVEKLITLKHSGEDMVSLFEYPSTYEFIETKIRIIQESLLSQKAEQHNVTKQLNELFRDILTAVWAGS